MNRRQNTYIMEKGFKGIVSDAGKRPLVASLARVTIGKAGRQA